MNKPLITSEQFPPNIDEIRKHFTLTGDELFCYGKIIYNPNKKLLTEDLLAHEAVHIEQQSNKAKEWWDLYLKDKVFRASQEIPAYQIQYRVAKKVIKDRNRLFNYLKQLAMNLSGETYGHVMTFHQAMEAIKAEELFDITKLSLNKV